MDPKLAASLSHFAFRFLKEQISNNKDKSKPLICSPLSVEMVLALTALGSAGDTHAELLKTMNLPDDDTLRSLFGYLTSTLKEVYGVTLNIANRLYVTKAGTLKPDIKKDAEEYFDSGLEQLDFTQSNDAANIMNAWVANQTNNMIPSIVSPSWLDKDTSLVMINAIYFEGLWKSPFLKGSTSDRTFHVDNTTDIKVPMMSKSCALFRYKHSPELKAKILQMYYQVREACMVFVLPDEIEGLSELMQKLANGHDLAAEVEDLETSLVDVMIPKFKVETEINLKKLLPKMGITKIFDEEQSDIRMLTTNERCYVSKAIQKAVIEVDEVGTKAAAATFSLKKKKKCKRYIPPDKQEFIADHPFFYQLIYDKIPLFLGIYEGEEVGAPDLDKPDAVTTDMLMDKKCRRYIPPDKQEFIADHPFFYQLIYDKIPLFLGIYEGEEVGAPDLDKPEAVTTGADD